jgi:hypothetical protein
MQHHVIVSFGKEQEFEFKFSGVPCLKRRADGLIMSLPFLSAMSQHLPGRFCR